MSDEGYEKEYVKEAFDTNWVAPLGENVNKFEEAKSANLLIGECTYSDKVRSMKVKSREKDLEKIKSIVYEVCIDGSGAVLFPAFSLMRTQVMLTILYDLFSNDENFNKRICVCSPLTKKISNLWENALQNEAKKEKWLYVKVNCWKVQSDSF